MGKRPESMLYLDAGVGVGAVLGLNDAPLAIGALPRVKGGCQKSAQAVAVRKTIRIFRTTPPLISILLAGVMPVSRIHAFFAICGFFCGRRPFRKAELSTESVRATNRSH